MRLESVRGVRLRHRRDARAPDGPEEVHAHPRRAGGARPDRGVRPPLRGLHERQPRPAGRVRAPAARCGAAGRGRPGAHAAVLACRRYLERFGSEAHVLPFATEPRAATSTRSGSTSSTARTAAGRRRLRRARRRGGLRAAGTGGARGDRRSAPAHRQLRPGVRRRRRPDPQPRRDDHRRDRQGEQRAARRRRQAVAGGGARDARAARRPLRGDRDGRRRPPPRRRARPARPIDDRPRPQRHQRATSTSTACRSRRGPI